MCLILLAVAGCGPTSVQSTSETTGQFPRPSVVLVYDFAVSPEEVRLDTGISPQIMQEIGQLQGTSRSAEEMKIGHAVADATAKELVKEITSYGLNAQRGLGWPAATPGTLMVKGQFLSIDEGNRTERVMLGFGLGRTSVQANVQVYALTPEGMRQVEAMRAQAKSGYKPGMVEMMGVGAAAGRLLSAVAVSSGVAGASEISWETVDADGRRLAKDVAKHLKQFFAQQGWISAGAADRTTSPRVATGR